MILLQTETGSDFEAILGFSFIAMLILGAILVRVVVLRSVSRLMFAKSDDLIDHEIPGADVPEHKADHKPRLLEITLPDGQDVVDKREEFVKRARQSFRTTYLVDALSCLGYVLLAMGSAKVAGYSPTPDSVWFVSVLAVVYFLFVTSARYFLFRKQFRALDFKLGVRWEHPAATLSRVLLAPRNEGFMFGLFIAFVSIVALTAFMTDDQSLDMNFHAPVVGIAILVAVIFHVGARFIFWRRSQLDRNVKLVILRVFGLDKAVRFTFGGILHFWQHFGSYFTVVDPSYMKHHFRLWSWKSVGTMIGVAGVWLSGLAVVASIYGGNDAGFDRVFNLAALPMGLLTLGAFSGGFYWRVRRSFARNVADIQTRIARVLKRPRNIGLGFKSLPLACFDNTWRLAVREFLTNADVVLMDLRGYSQERKGCEFEVDFLFDNIDIGRVVFLVDTESDRQSVHKLIEDRWEYLRANSPNRGATDPVARIYISAEGKKEDMQGLLDTLLSVA